MTVTTTAGPSATSTERRGTWIARAVTEVFAPWVLIIVLFLAVGWHSAHVPGLA
ncbi:hypothetical protein NE235_02545 [Actinoallomurus spadix]|uniref:ABC transporter permease n=1 Tax=Actinoallomurus spadix TaxID=79912 RepID=A0ABN0XK63_9ACTN|nr:hypothetical protein [Actinoallomurus spadix]MCO5984981.1 hypothetical protein [Actinoallomurus spadix]